MKWKVGQTVQVQSRTWAGINKPGGCGRITKVRYFDESGNIQGLDVKYVLGGGSEKNLDPNLVFHFEALQRGGRKRRGRDFLMEREEDKKPEKTQDNKVKPKRRGSQNKTTKCETVRSETENDEQKTARREAKIAPPTKTPQRRKRTTEKENPPRSPSEVRPLPQLHQLHPRDRKKVAKKPLGSAKKRVTAASSGKPVVVKSKDDNNKPPMEVVYADQSIEVSPLDRALSRKEKNRSPEVRRGLFESRKKAGGIISPSAHRKSEKIEAAKQAAAAAVSGAPPSSSTTAKVTAATPTSATTPGPFHERHHRKHKKKKEEQTAPPSPSPVRRCGPPRSYETPTQSQQQQQQHHQSSSFSRHQQRPLHVAAAKKRQAPSSSPKLRLPRPPPKRAVAPGKSVPLKRVFENEMQKARRFIDDLIKPREEEEGDCEEEEEDRREAPSSPSRFVRFMTTFNRIRLMRMDDGVMEEADFLELVNADAVRAFSKSEVDAFLEKLSEQEKVMTSEGNIYII